MTLFIEKEIIKERRLSIAGKAAFFDDFSWNLFLRKRIRRFVFIHIMPEAVDDIAIGRQVFLERREYLHGVRTLPVSGQFAGQGEYGDQLGAGFFHAGGSTPDFQIGPGAAGVDDGEHLISVIQQGQSRKGAAGADGGGGNDDMVSAGGPDQVIKSFSERGIGIGIDDSRAAVNRFIREDFL